MFISAVCFVIGYVWSDVYEYFSHKFLHRFTNKRWKILSSHWRKHHVNSRRNGMKDIPTGNEGIFILLSAVLYWLLLWSWAPWIWIGIVAGSAEYLYVHWRSHVNPEWAKTHLPWHYKHHMSDQRRNWGVRRPWVDKLLGTYES